MDVVFSIPGGSICQSNLNLPVQIVEVALPQIFTDSKTASHEARFTLTSAMIETDEIYILRWLRDNVYRERLK